jgi:hypothetical protein
MADITDKLHEPRGQDCGQKQAAAWDAFFGSFSSGDLDLAERCEEILPAELR